MTPSLSVIIVNYNTIALLEKCLASLLSNDGRISMEIIVVDNNSSDGSVKKTATKFLDVRLIENEQNLGFSKACNQGLEVATCDYVLFLNPDTTVPDRALEQCVAFMREHRDVGLLGCKLLNTDGSLQPSCADFPYLRNIFLDHMLRRQFFPETFRQKMLLRCWRHDRIREVDWVLGAFMLTRRSLMERLNGFDEDFFLYGEDLDLCYRIEKAGWRVVFFPEAGVVHVGNPVWDDARKGLVYKALLTFYKKHFGIWKYILLKSFILGPGERRLSGSKTTYLQPIPK